MPANDKPNHEALPPSHATQPLGSLPDMPEPDADPDADLEAKEVPQAPPLPPRRTNVDTVISKAGAHKRTLPPAKVEPEVAQETGGLGDVGQGFEVMESFAEGGQGRIASARDRTLKRMVAIKTLREDLLEDEGQVESFLAEAGVTAQLDHPSIVPLYALCSDAEGGLHIAMKMVNGKTLTAYLNDTARMYREHGVKHFDEREALFTRLEYFLKICEAISYAHNRGVLHRDLKSENVMIGEYGEVYVMDWGLAIDREEIEGAPVEKIRQGTPGYMAPEVIQNRGLTEAADIFALGCILFEVVTLQRAFPGKLEDVLRNTVAGKPRPVEHLCPGATAHGDIAAIVRKAMHRDSRQRYESVEQLREDVRRFLAGQEVAARPDNAVRAVGRWLFLHKQLTALIVLAFLLSCAGFGIHQLIGKYQAEQLARQRQFVLTNLQDEVSARAHSVDRHLLKLEAALRNYAGRAAFLLEYDPDQTHEEDHGFHEYTELQDLATAPEGTVASPLYGENVSLDFSNLKWAPGPVPADSERLLRRLGPLDHGLLGVLVESDPNIRYDQTREAHFKELAITEGFPLRFVYIGLSNGLLLCYPGKSQFDEAYDPRKRPWYVLAVESDHVIWTKPYYDAFGQGLILSACYAVRDRSGEVLGVAGLDVTLEYIVSQLMEVADHDSGLPSRRFLLDEEGMILLDSSLESMEDEAKEAESAELQLKPYEHRAISRFLTEGRGGQLQFHGPLGITVLACAPIEGVGWYFVEEIPIGGVDFATLSEAWGMDAPTTGE